MLRGFYTAASGMMAQQRYQESLSNNMANALTPGYKQDRSTFRAFPEMLIRNIESYREPTLSGLNIPYNYRVGAINTGTYMQEDVPLFDQGPIQQTDISTDLAIINGNFPDENGFVFFTVQNAEGDVRYTRNGNFTVDAEGYLTTQEGYYVLNSAGERILVGTEQFEVNTNGEITSPFDNTMLGIVYHPNANDFVKEGTNLFNNAGDVEVVDARAEGIDFRISQGQLERSNVDIQFVMTEMIRSYRMFEINQQVVKMFDQSMDLAANQIGRLR